VESLDVGLKGKHKPHLSPFRESIYLHLKTRADFKKTIRHQFQGHKKSKGGHKTPSLRAAWELPQE